MLKIGIIGAGAIGQAFAKQVTMAGYEVIISNSRGKESLTDFVKSLKGNIKAGSVQESAKADVIFLAVPWKNIPDLTKVVSSWDKIVIDASNPIIMPGFQIAELNGKMSSEVVADLLIGAKIVKAFNTLTSALLASNTNEAGGRRVIFFSGNDESAKMVVAGIIEKIGFAAVDLGRLNEGGKLMNFPDGPLPTLNLIKLP